MELTDPARGKDKSIAIYNPYFDRFLCVSSWGRVWQSEIRNTWENFEIVRQRDNIVAIRSINGHYLSAQRYGVIQTRTNVDKWETFVKEDFDDIFCLRNSNGKYLVFEQDGSVKCNWSSYADRGLGKFKIMPPSHTDPSRKLIYNPHWDRHLCGAPFSAFVKENHERREQDYFQIEEDGTGCITIRSIFGLYLSASNDGVLQFQVNRVTTKEKFIKQEKGGRKFCLCTWNGTYLTYDKGRWTCQNRQVAGPFELFEFKTKSWESRRLGLWALKHNKIRLTNTLAREMIMFI